MRSALLSQKNVVESSPCTPLIHWHGRSASVTVKKEWRLRTLPGLTVVVTLVSLVAILSPALKLTGRGRLSTWARQTSLETKMALRTHKEAEPASLPYIFGATKSWS